MHVELCADPLSVARAAADQVARCLAQKPDAALVLPAGATPVPLYAELVRRAAASELDLSRAHLFQLDEMLGLTPGDPRSFRAFFREHLFDPLAASGARPFAPPLLTSESDFDAPTHPRNHLLNGAAADPAAEIRAQARALEELGGADLVLLGLGRNGHVGFNEPGTLADTPARVVDLAEATRTALAPVFAFASPPESPPERGMTLGLRELRAARATLVLVTGAGKRDILAAWSAGASGDALPAAHLPETTRVLADAAAAGPRSRSQ